MRGKALPATALALLMCTSLAFADGAAGGRIIESVDDGVLHFQDGGTFDMPHGTRVEKAGYEFTVDDLRPGWAVEIAYGRRAVPTIKVVGIPPIRLYPESRSVREVVAVARCELGMMPTAEALQGVDLQQAIETLTASALEATDRFIVVDLAGRDEILNEQDFGRSGYANVRTAAAGGRMMTARYLVKPTIVDFAIAHKSGTGFGALGVAAVRSRVRARIAMELRLIDVETGHVAEVVDAERAFGSKATQLSVNLAQTAGALAVNSSSKGLHRLERLAAAGIGFARNGFNESPLGELLSLAVDDLVTDMIGALEGRPWESVVVRVVDDGTVIVRGGADVGLREGDVLTVLSKSEAILDPETGENLGVLTAETGTIEIVAVQDRLSIAKVVLGERIKRGDLCRLPGGA